MELSMAALLAAAFAYRNIISLVCVGFVAIGMASAPQACARLWRVLVRTCIPGAEPCQVTSYVCSSRSFSALSAPAPCNAAPVHCWIYCEAAMPEPRRAKPSTLLTSLPCSPWAIVDRALHD